MCDTKYHKWCTPIIRISEGGLIVHVGDNEGVTKFPYSIK